MWDQKWKEKCYKYETRLATLPSPPSKNIFRSQKGILFVLKISTRNGEIWVLLTPLLGNLCLALRKIFQCSVLLLLCRANQDTNRLTSKHFAKLNLWVLRNTFKSLCRNYYTERNTERNVQIWETLEKEIPQLYHLLGITEKNLFFPLLAIISKGSLKLPSQMGKQVAPENSWRINE